MIIPIIVLAGVFILIAIRRIGNIRLQIWQVMLFGAIAVLLTGQITPIDALESINLDVILFLFGMFVVGQALEESGYLSYISQKIFRRAKSADQLVLYILFGIGVASAFLMNDTLAIVGTPVVLLLAKKNDMPAKLLLHTLAFAVTIGSIMSPIGNPQNLLIAINGNIASPFVTFFGFLSIPTVINLFLAYILLKLFYKKHFHSGPLANSQEEIKDRRLASLSRISLILIVLLVLTEIITVTLGTPIDFRLTYIALISSISILLLSPKRFDVIKRIDWYTLVFLQQCSS